MVQLKGFLINKNYNNSYICEIHYGFPHIGKL